MQRAHDALEAELSKEDESDEAAIEAARAAFNTAEEEQRSFAARVEEAERIEEARANLPVRPDEDTKDKKGTATPDVRVSRDELTYEFRGERSFLRDLWAATHDQDRGAAARLARHTQEMVVERGESRDLSSSDTAGGEFVPPLWVQDEWISLARAARPFANAIGSRPLPPNTDSINYPKVTGGTAVATQSDGGAVQETDAVTASVNIPVRTAAGQQDVSRQLLDRSLPGIDEVLFADLLADYNTKLDVQTLNGSGTAPNAKGVLQDSNIISVTYTDASPTVGEAYLKIADAIQQICTNRFLPPSLLAMHPRRWYWFVAALDTTNRPLVVPAQHAPVNALGLLENVGAENLVGTLLGLPVIIDSSIPTTGGAGTNEDTIIATRREDLVLMEDDTPRMRVYEEVLSGTLSVRLQVYNYFAFSSERYSKASAKITGTGFVAPTF